MDLQTTPNNQPSKRLSTLAKSLSARNENQQWEEFVAGMLEKLELSPEKHAAAERRYKDLGRHVARKMGIGPTDAHVVVQGSMRTQTTIAGDGREKFDLDIVVKLCGAEFGGLQESEQFFQTFGAALHGIEGAGDPKPKSRCWRLQYPGEPFYFDVTPAIPMSEQIIGTDLRVRDPETTWSPSNPEEFADWFCTIANQRFTFQERMYKSAIALDEARTTVDPIPRTKVGLDDILRRLVQLIKLHRDGYYKKLPEARGEARPISVILVTLATRAYHEMVRVERNNYSSAIEVALEVIDRMPQFIRRDGKNVFVDNPALPGKAGENFADRWNKDGGLREREFKAWHGQLVADLEALFSEEYTKRSETRINAVFGEAGVRAWKNSQPQSNVLNGLLASAPAQSRSQPQAPRATGSRDTLA
ncbi:MAG: nucleotidyltransferase [Burkholderiaceae bacterium]|nr:nucleotidyltransferase [Burkholderiaceae bacterium]MDP3136629.1 nucleotidyltransferase [Burkholderiaceae bacterium]